MTQGSSPSRRSAGSRSNARVRVAFVNNMPESAFLQTERQFSSLLDRCALPVQLDRYLVEGLPGPASLPYGYKGLAELYRIGAEAVIVSGAEPRTTRVDTEPLWRPLVDLFSWAVTRQVSLLCSCLAAHAAVAFFDGLERVPLPVKRFGVLEQRVDPAHQLAAQLPPLVGFPHSRWNDVPLPALLGSGYRLLLHDRDEWTVATTERGGASVTLIQGHPEYEADTLLREFRRDLRRYLRGEQERLPVPPTGYLQPEAQGRLEGLLSNLIGSPRREEPLETFPLAELVSGVGRRWELSARQLYVNWVTELSRRRGAPVAAG